MQPRTFAPICRITLPALTMQAFAAPAIAALALGFGSPAAAQDVIRIGEINSYSAQPAFTLPYRNGLELAIDEVNASGGALAASSSC